nr:hypothetical transcript [Hymenolepis microstoma]
MDQTYELISTKELFLALRHATEGGRGHQAFVGGEFVRNPPPHSTDSSDYSSVAFLTTCSDKCSTEYLLQSTIASIFLTYCLYIGGYPMKWCKLDLYTPPSPENRPKCIPASWVAACLLYHIQSVDINAFNVDLSTSQNISGIGKKFVNIGAMLFPTISLINHSCNPSAFLIMSRRGIGCLIASKTLAPDSEIFIQYSGDFYDNSKEKRQNYLKPFHFERTCEACVNEWTYNVDNKEEKIICPLCNTFFSSVLEACPLCSSRSGPERYSKLWNDDFKNLAKCMKNGNANLETLTTTADVSAQAQSLVEPPAITIKRARTMLIWSIMIKYGNWVNLKQAKFVVSNILPAEGNMVRIMEIKGVNGDTCHLFHFVL